MTVKQFIKYLQEEISIGDLNPDAEIYCESQEESVLVDFVYMSINKQKAFIAGEIK